MSNVDHSRYACEAKSAYRRELHAAIDKACPIPRPIRRIAYLESPEGLETRFLLDRGYSPSNLYPITRRVGEAAWISRNTGDAGIKAHAGDWADLFHGRLSSVMPHVIDFDGMGPASEKSLYPVVEAIKTVTHRVVVAMTVLAGREAWRDDDVVQRWLLNQATDPHSGAASVQVPNMNGTCLDNHRAHIITTMLLNFADRAVLPRATKGRFCWSGRYISAVNQPMLWVVVSMDRAGRTFDMQTRNGAILLEAETRQRKRFKAPGSGRVLGRIKCY